MVFEPGTWTVQLHGGGEIVLRADAFAVDAGVYRFTVLMSGDPNFEMEVARLSADVVDDVYGGPTL